MVVSPSIARGQVIVAAFAQSTLLFFSEVLNIQIGFQNEDDFAKDLVCLRGELRSGLAVPVPVGLEGHVADREYHAGEDARRARRAARARADAACASARARSEIKKAHCPLRVPAGDTKP
jgi:hypothetical protein